MKVLIVVTHLLGTGHLRRAMLLAQSFADAGHAVRLVSGGTPVAGIDDPRIPLIQLPALKSDGTAFTTLLDADGAPVTDSLMAARQSALRAALDWHPDVLLTELYPFGRRALADEFTVALDAAHALHPRPMIFCSIRDILAPPSKPEKAHKTHAVIDTYYDAVLVHSDETATPLSASWPVSDGLAGRLIYTGFVAPSAPVPHPENAGAGEILVSAGGGPVGAPVFEAACAAARLAPDLRWRLLVGGPNPTDEISRLSAQAPDTVQINPARPDFRQMLCHAVGSVSMAGYNTAMDILQTGIPALLIPFDAGGETEQSLRAQSLAHLPGISVLRSAELSGETLLAALRPLLAMPRRGRDSVALDGAAQTVRLVEQAWKANA